MEERIQKILAHAGFGSRRDCETMISTGRVTVNGQIASLGAKADPASDQIRVDGVLVPASEAPVYIALYKPRGVLSTVDAPDARQTVRDLVPVAARVYPVGRLDVDSEGLMLLTNDGDLANRLTHPRFGHEKEYRVLVARRPDSEQLETWQRGVVLEDGYKTQPARVTMVSTYGKGAWLVVVMREGRKRQIRETGSLLGLPVVRIVRTRIGSLRIGNLKSGEWRYLVDQEIKELREPAAYQPASPRAKRAFERTSAARQAAVQAEKPARLRQASRYSDEKTEQKPTGRMKPPGSRAAARSPRRFPAGEEENQPAPAGVRPPRTGRSETRRGYRSDETNEQSNAGFRRTPGRATGKPGGQPVGERSGFKRGPAGRIGATEKRTQGEQPVRDRAERGGFRRGPTQNAQSTPGSRPPGGPIRRKPGGTRKPRQDDEQ